MGYSYFDIQIEFVNASDRAVRDEASTDSVRIEQANTGKREYKDFATWLADEIGAVSDSSWDRMNFYYEEYQAAYCNADGSLPLEFKIYKSRRDLEYTLFLSRGELEFEEPTIKTELKKESITITDVASYTFEAEITAGITCANWVTPVYDINNIQIESPNIIVQEHIDDLGRVTYSLGFEDLVCSGTISCIRSIEYDFYTVSVDPRSEGQSYEGDDVETTTTSDVIAESGDESYNEDDVTSAYDGHITATWASGHTTKEMEIPEKLDSNCLQGGTTIDDDDDDDDGDENCYNRIITVDPCTSEVVSDELVQVTCSED